MSDTNGRDTVTMPETAGGSSDKSTADRKKS